MTLARPSVSSRRLVPSVVYIRRSTVTYSRATGVQRKRGNIYCLLQPIVSYSKLVKVRNYIRLNMYILLP